MLRLRSSRRLQSRVARHRKNWQPIHDVEPLEMRCVLASAPVAMDDAFSVNEDTILSANDPSSVWTSAIQLSSPLHWWDFEDMTGNTLRDRGRAAKDATLSESGVTLDQPGAVGHAAYFDGTGYAVVGEPSMSTDWTVETIAKIEVQKSYAHSLLGISSDDPQNANVTIRLSQYPTTGEIGITHYGEADWRLGVPSPETFSLVTFVGTSQSITLYVDGNNVAQLDRSLPLSRYLIGCGHVDAPGSHVVDPLAGWLDELVIYDRALTAQEIESHATAMATTMSGGAVRPDGVLLNDTDADGDPLTATLVTSTTHGTLTFQPNGGFRYVPAPNYFGPDEFTYRTSDGTSSSNLARVALQVLPVNDSPQAADDRDYSTVRDQPLTIDAAHGVLVNDTDLENDPITATLVTPPLSGTVTFGADGSFVYTPKPGAFGQDGFTYRVSDGKADSNVAQVRIQIARTDASGVFASDDTYTVAEDGQLTVDTSPWKSSLQVPLQIQYLAYDPAGDRLFATIPYGSGPLGGTLTEIDPYTGKIGPSIKLPSYVGEVIISDDGSTLWAVVDDWRGVQMIDLATMTLGPKIVTAPYGVGALTPRPGTSDSMAMVLWDGGIRQPVGTYIYEGNKKLPKAGPGNAISFDETGDRLFTYENWISSFSFWELAVNDTGLDVTRQYPGGSMLSGFAAFQYANGHLFTTGGGIVNVGTKKLVGSFEGGNFFHVYPSENTLYTYDETRDRFTTYDLATLTKRNSISAAGMNVGGVRQIVTRFGEDGLAVYNESTLTLVRSDELFGITRHGVLRNDKLPGVENPVVTLVRDVEHGTLQLSADGTFQYQPQANFNGSDSFTYSVVDSTGKPHTATVQLNVTPVNDLPTAENDVYLLPASGGALSVDAAHGLLANDSDAADGDKLTAVVEQSPQFGRLRLLTDGSFTYTPRATFVLSDQFTYRASDGQERSEIRTVQIRLNVPSIEVGSHILKANTPNQRIEIRVVGGQTVAGLDLYAQVGDGGPERTSLGLSAGIDGPAITHVELKDQTIFAQVPDASTDLGSLPQVANWSISVTGGGGVIADGLLASLLVDTTGFFEGSWQLRLSQVLPDHPLGPLDSRFASMLAFITNGSIQVVPAEVINRHVFYNNSNWDGNDPAANADDDQAIATDKAPLLPGATARFANYTNYSRGINGVMLDVRGLPSDREVGLDDFELLVGRQSEVGNWLPAPAPTLTVRRGAGESGSDRITLTWPDNAIENAWLQVRLKSGEDTLLGHDDVFYFGNAIGETGTTLGNSFVTSVDVIGARDHQRGPFDLAPIDDLYDFNRDRLVSSTDVILARDHQTGALTSLPLITAPRALASRAASPLEDLVVDDSHLLRPTTAELILGDMNGDGQFDTSDIVAAFQRGKFGSSVDVLYSDGDWDGDGDFDHDDLAAAVLASAKSRR